MGPDPFTLVGFVAAGAGLLFALSDPHSDTSRAQALCLVLIGLRLLFAPLEVRMEPATGARLGSLIEVAAILSGIEWARRVGRTAAGRAVRAVQALFRAAQILVLVFGFLQLLYLWLWPEAAVRDQARLIDVRGIEWAMFAPVLGTAMLLSGIAIVMLLIVRTDPAESIRLRALVLAAPFLLAGLVVSRGWVPLVLVTGLLIFMAGTVRYLIVHAQRAQAMSQFLSPEVARMVKLRGIERTLRQERREISVVVCDLRGFTSFAREHEPVEVVSLLERYYAIVGEVAQHHGATVKDHAGDGVLILVGAPVARTDHALRGVRLALELVSRVGALVRGPDVQLGVGAGVAAGEVAVGAIHGSGRLEYVAVGAPVNLAARLCQHAEAGEVLVDDAIRAALADALPVEPRPPVTVKGYATAVPMWCVSDAVATARA